MTRRMTTEIHGTVTAIDFVDGLGTIATDDGRVVRFGLSAWKGPGGTKPEVGTAVRIEAIVPGFRGSERAQGVRPRDGGEEQLAREVERLATDLARVGVALGPAEVAALT